MPYDPLASIDIPWEMMNVFLEGRSAIDVPRLYLQTLDEADAFLASYGYRWENPEERAEALDIREEALTFLHEQLLFDEPNLEMPAEVREQKDLRKLLLWASTDPRGERQRWSCILLRVMHTFVHCGSYFQQMFSEQIQAQILDRFEPHVHRSDRGVTLGQGGAAIPLVEFQFRRTKSRNSLAMKMLQKAENVGADIFDWVGLRFVTRERFDALLVVRYLRANSLVMFAHVKPGRSRNTLVDTDRVRIDMQQVDEEVRAGRLAEHERWQRMRELVRAYPYPGAAERSYNPFSASSYHSIQFTCSQQVRVPNPYMGRFSKVLSSMDQRAPSVVGNLTRGLQRVGVGSDVHFFFPYEIQILDQQSFEASRSGRASHDVYKEKQRYAVKKRLFGTDDVLSRTGMFEAFVAS
jgi:uncharacterized protein (TIGR04562 family)